MKFKNIQTLFTITLIIFGMIQCSSALSAPMPDCLVINQSKKQCGYFWPGDEFSYYTPSAGWKIYESYGVTDEVGNATWQVSTPYGICSVNAFTDATIQECCRQLKLTYVGEVTGDYSKGMDRYQEISFWSTPLAKVIVAVSGIVILLGLVILAKGILKRKK